MVFSVQQGEHGPLVTYKLEIPETVETVETLPSTADDYRRLFAATSDEAAANPLQHAHTGEAITLEQVSAELEWRRDTAEKLRRMPVGPRF